MDKKTETAKGTEKKSVSESVYTVKELAASAEAVFGENVKKECVIAAFRAAGKTQGTKAEAQEIVRKFMKKGVI